LNDDQYGAGWHLRCADLSAHQGKSISTIVAVNDTDAPAGDWGIVYNDIGLLSTGGAVRPIYNRHKSNKAVDIVAIDLAGATKEQIKQIAKYVAGLSKEQQNRVTYIE